MNVKKKNFNDFQKSVSFLAVSLKAKLKKLEFYFFENHWIFFSLRSNFGQSLTGCSIFFRVFKMDLLTYNFLQVIQSRAIWSTFICWKGFTPFQHQPSESSDLESCSRLTDLEIILFGSDSFLTKYDLQLIMYVSWVSWVFWVSWVSLEAHCLEAHC